MVVGDGWIKYVVVGIEDARCGKIEYGEENLDDQNRIFLLEDVYRV